MSRLLDPRNYIPNGHNYTEAEAARIGVERGSIDPSSREWCRIFKENHWDFSRAHARQSEEFNGVDLTRQNTHQSSQPQSRGQGGFTRIDGGREASQSRMYQREAVLRQRQQEAQRVQDWRDAARADQEIARLRSFAAQEQALQARRDGIQHTHGGRPVEPQLTEGESIEIQMPGESAWTRIFTALVGRR